MNEAINLKEKFKLFSDLWSPKRIGKLNGQQILLAKIKGEFVSINTMTKTNYFLL